MGKYPWLRRRRFFINRALQGRFVVGLAVLVSCGLFVDLLAAYVLIQGRLDARLYKIHLQASSTSDIIWPVIWKLSVFSVPFIVIAGLVFGYILTRSLERGLACYVEGMKNAGWGGDLTVRIASPPRHLESSRRAFNDAMELFDERFAALQTAAFEIEGDMKGLRRHVGSPGRISSKAEVIERLEGMSSKTDYALKKLLTFKV